MLTLENSPPNFTNNIPSHNPTTHINYPNNYSFNKSITNGITTSNNTSSKFQLLSESSKTWETFAMDDLLTFLDLDVHPIMLIHLIQEMFHITLHLLRDLISETLISVRKALKLPPKEETIRNIENRVKPLFKENLDEIFCSETESEKFRKKFNNEYTSFFLNELNLKYCEEDKFIEFNNMLEDKGFHICLSNVKLILLFCEFNEEQLCLDDIENNFNERCIEVIPLKVNGSNYRKPYLIFNETQNCKKVIPILNSPLIKKSKHVFNKDKFKSIVISITDQQENTMKIYPLTPPQEIIVNTSSYEHPMETFDNIHNKKCSYEHDNEKEFVLSSQRQYCDTERYIKNRNKFAQKKMSLSKCAHKLFFNSIRKDDIQYMMNCKYKNNKNYKYVNDNKNNNFSATKISNRNKCLLFRFSYIESNSYRNGSKYQKGGIKHNERKLTLDNDKLRLSSQQKNRTRSTYHKSNAYENRNTLSHNSNVFIDKDLFFIKTLQIPKTKRDINDNNHSTSQELLEQNKHQKKCTQMQNDNFLFKHKMEISDNHNEISAGSNNQNKKKNIATKNKNICNGKTNLMKRITKLTKVKY